MEETDPGGEKTLDPGGADALDTGGADTPDKAEKCEEEGSEVSTDREERKEKHKAPDEKIRPTK